MVGIKSKVDTLGTMGGDRDVVADPSRDPGEFSLQEAPLNFTIAAIGNAQGHQMETLVTNIKDFLFDIPYLQREELPEPPPPTCVPGTSGT